MSYLKHIDEQLTLRQFAEHDAADFFSLVDANREAIGSFMLWVRDVDGEQKIRSMIAEWLDEHEKTGALSLGVYDSGRLMGAVFHLRADRTHQHVEIGYWLAADARGKGLATRAVKAMFDLTFDELGFHRAYLRIAPHNDKSIAIAERLMLEKEGVLRDLWQVEPGVWWDGVVYATTADRWAKDKTS